MQNAFWLHIFKSSCSCVRLSSACASSVGVLHVHFLVLGSRGQHGHGGPLGGDAADLHVREGAASLAAAVGHRGRGGDDVLEPVQRDDEQREQKGQQAEEEPHVDVDVALASRRRRSSRRGR